MKKVITQTYELTVSYTVDVPDEYDEYETASEYGELNIRTDIFPDEDEMKRMGVEEYCLDGVVFLNTYVANDDDIVI